MQTFWVQFALCDAPSYHGRKAGRKAAFMLPSCTPAPPSWCPGHLPACDQLSPRNTYFLVFLLRPPEASLFLNKIWAVLLEPWREESTASAFYCCGCWCLCPHWQGEQRIEERAWGFSPVTVYSVSYAFWSQYWGTADFEIPYFKQFVTEELKHFRLNWNFLLSFSQNMGNAWFFSLLPTFFFLIILLFVQMNVELYNPLSQLNHTLIFLSISRVYQDSFALA